MYIPQPKESRVSSVYEELVSYVRVELNSSPHFLLFDPNQVFYFLTITRDLNF